MSFTWKIFLRVFVILVCCASCCPQILNAGICTTYNGATGIAHIPSLRIGQSYYWVDLKHTGDIFRLLDMGAGEKMNACAEYDGNSMSVHIPCVDLKAASTYWVDFGVKCGEYIDLAITDLGVNTGDLVINEILAKDASDGSDWVELYVKGSQSINLADYFLADADHEKSSLPSVTLYPGQFYLIQATDDVPADGSAYVPFKLGTNDTLILYENENILDVFEWEEGDAPKGFSYGRLPDGTGVLQTLSPTPGAANAAGSTTNTQVLLNGNAISINGSGASAEGSILNITSAGKYTLSGSLTDGQIIVNTEDAAAVALVLNGVDIRCSTGSAIYVMNAEETVIVLADNTENYLSDGIYYTILAPETDEPNATVFSKDDLTVSGSGSLTVMGNYNDGIASKDDLVISGGAITVNSVDDGIRGKESLEITDGHITVNAGGQGLKSDNDDEEMGSISVEGGKIQVTSGGDAIHSTGSIVISGGYFSIASDDDAIHADASVKISGGEINISKSYEGIESTVITISDGTIRIVSSDDGINVVEANDGSGTNPQSMPGGTSGQDAFIPSRNCWLYINGGYIVVDAGGDGIDVNGSIEMTAGLVIVNGPLSDANSALDYDGSFKISGGFLVGAGSTGMAQAPDTSSSQNSLLINFNSPRQSGSLIHIRNSDGGGILTFAPSKRYQSVVFSSPDLLMSSTYEVYLGGRSTGTMNDGLYQNGVYTPGTEYTSFTVSSPVTKIGIGDHMPF